MARHTKARRVVAISHGTSRLRIAPGKGRGVINAVIPSTRPIFAILEPIAFPMASVGDPSIDAITPTKISGAEVPTDTTVSPIIILDTPKLFAVIAAYVTKRSALHAKAIKPTINPKIDNNMLRIN